MSDRVFYAANGTVSFAAVGFLTWLLLLHSGSSQDGLDLSFMPAVNACLNATAAVLLVLGYRAIRKGQRNLHRTLMISAFLASTVFLVGYVLYHSVHGDTPYQGTGALRVVYFTVLISHILLSITVVPLALTTFYFAFRKRYSTHRKVARVTLPIWLYVSVTGVLIYFMLDA